MSLEKLPKSSLVVKRGVKGSRNWIIRDCIQRGLSLSPNGDIVMNGKTLPIWINHDNRGKLRRRICLSVFQEGALKKCYFNYSRLVCWLMNGEPPFESAEVDHINRNTLDDSPENLRWVSSRENTMNGSGRPVSEGGQGKLDEVGVMDIRGLCRCGISQNQIAGEFGVGHAVVSGVKLLKRWGHLEGETGREELTEKYPHLFA